MKDNKSNKYYESSFWDEFYTSHKNEQIDWFFDFNSLKLNEFKISTIKKKDNILLLGVGLSSISDILYKNEYENVDIIDFSKEVYNYLKSKYENYKNWDIFLKNITEINQNDFNNSYDVIIDKGCIDCILTDPSNGESKFMNTLKKITKFLKIKGKFYYFSYSDFSDRINYFYDIPNIKYECYQIPQHSFIDEHLYEYDDDDNCYSLYIIKRLK